MANQPTTAHPAIPTLPAMQVYGMASLCLVAGLAIGYLSHGSQSSASRAQPVVKAAIVVPHGAAMGGQHRPSLDEMKQLAGRQAAPLLEKLKSDPKNSTLLMQLGALYHTTHQFKEAAAYYEEAVQVAPKDVALRTRLASSLYRTGDVDGALAQLNQGLSYDPKDANSLFDLGMIRLQGKGDGKGALAAWQKLLKSNPQLSPDRKATVQKLMADVLTSLGDQRGVQGARQQ
jgi:cytochrome c-type biogenesis protein CcmH/NrfG